MHQTRTDGANGLLEVALFDSHVESIEHHFRSGMADIVHHAHRICGCVDEIGFDGFELYEKIDDKNYTMRAEYATNDQFRTLIQGKLWQKVT